MVTGKRLAGAACMFLVVTVVQAGTLSTNNFADGSDAATGISTATTYTHLIDVNPAGEVPVINGVAFNNMGSYALAGVQWFKDNVPNSADSGSGMEDLLDFGYYNGAFTLTLMGLTPETPYKLRLYVDGDWGGIIGEMTFDDTTVPTAVSDFDRGGGQAGVPSSYDYTYVLPTGDTDLYVTVPVGFHWYGFSNEEIPTGPAPPSEIGEVEPEAVVLNVVNTLGSLQWQKSANGSTWSDVDGATADALDVTALYPDTPWFRVEATSGTNAPAYSTTMLVTAGAGPGMVLIIR